MHLQVPGWCALTKGSGRLPTQHPALSLPPRPSGDRARSAPRRLCAAHRAPHRGAQWRSHALHQLLRHRSVLRARRAQLSQRLRYPARAWRRGRELPGALQGPARTRAARVLLGATGAAASLGAATSLGACHQRAGDHATLGPIGAASASRSRRRAKYGGHGRPERPVDATSHRQFRLRPRLLTPLAQPSKPPLFEAARPSTPLSARPPLSARARGTEAS